MATSIADCAFLAGAVLRLIDADADADSDAATVHPNTEVTLDAIGFGFLPAVCRRGRAGVDAALPGDRAGAAAARR